MADLPPQERERQQLGRSVVELGEMLAAAEAKVAELERERDDLKSTRFAGVLASVEEERESYRRRLHQATEALGEIAHNPVQPVAGVNPLAERLLSVAREALRLIGESPWTEQDHPSAVAARSALAALKEKDD